MILLSGFGGMWLLSYIWARSLKKGLTFERNVPFGWMQVGDFLKERVSLENAGWAPSLWVHIDDHSNMPGHEISSISDIRGFQNRHWYSQGVCNTRGLYTLGAVTLVSEDPFGLYKITVDYHETVNMIVVPPVISLPEMDIAPGGRIGDGRSSAKGIKQTVSTAGVREYIPGDSLRWLHWPTTARMGKPYVHLFDNEPSSDWWVLLDMDPEVQVGEGENSTEEHGVILAASLVNQGMQNGKHVGMIAQGNELVWHTPEIGDSHLWSVLRSLATLQPGGPPLGKILNSIRSSLGQRTSLIIITASPSTDWLNALGQLKRSGIVPTVILLDPVSFGGEVKIDLVRNRLMKLGVTHYTIGSNLLDKPKNELKDGLISWLLRNGRDSGPVIDVWQARWLTFRKNLHVWILYFLFFYGMANALSKAVRGLDNSLMGSLIGGGLLFGWLLGRSSIPGWAYALLNTLIGAVLDASRVGRLGNTILALFPRTFDFLAQTISWVSMKTKPPDIRPITTILSEIWRGFSTLGIRFWDWTVAIIRGQAFYDPVVTAFLWGLLIWGSVVWAVWGIRRRDHPLLAFLPGLVVVTSSLAAIDFMTYDLVLMLGVTLASMVLINHDAREHFWQTSQLKINDTIRTNVLIAAILLSFALMFLSVITPSISIDRLTQYYQQLTVAGDTGTGGGIADSLGLENQADTDIPDILVSRRSGGLPNKQLIGSGPELSEQVVMVMRIENLPVDIAGEAEASSLLPLYLRSLTYDRYIGSGWVSRDAVIRDYDPGDQLPTYQAEADHLVRQQIQVVEDLGGILHSVGIPVSTDRDFRISWRLYDDQQQVYDLFGGTVDGDTYRVDSLYQIYSAEQLRSAGQVYPEWIISRYMTLPEEVPERVLTLARDLTATELTPYDRAVALEHYLRQIPYSLDVSFLPSGEDMVDFFLFELKKGYCDYYASAMVVLARAAGIPARFVIGYIVEYYDQVNDVYMITADQAHSWVEIFFPDYGWITFEPTGGRPEIERPTEGIPELPDNFEFDLSPLVPKTDFSQIPWGQIVGFSLLALIAIFIIGLRVSDCLINRIPVDKRLPRLYKRIYRYARWMGLSIMPGDTPYEFQRELTTYLDRMGRGSYWADWLLLGKGMLAQLTENFVDVLFNPLEMLFVDSKKTTRLYQRLRYRLWLLWLLGIVYRFQFLRPLFWADIPLSSTLTIEDIK
jgi:transglutaminase-like putative cysteine protease/uncharacterized protein (DUF58 family)